MDKFVISGGAALRGEIAVGGSKNSALPALAAALLTEEPVTLRRIPRVRDMQRLIIPAAQKWLKPLGGAISLLKPYYELAKQSPSGKPPARVEEAQARDVCGRISRELAQAGWGEPQVIESPLWGKGGNLEFLLYLKRGISP